MADSTQEMNDKIDEFKDLLKITDTQGTDMILSWLKPFDLKKYV